MRIAGLFLAVLVFFPVLADCADASGTFSGRVIYSDTGSIEVKKGRTEMQFMITESTRVMSNRQDRAVKDLELCQNVAVKYGQGNVALEVDIVRESDCRP